LIPSSNSEASALALRRFNELGNEKSTSSIKVHISNGCQIHIWVWRSTMTIMTQVSEHELKTFQKVSLTMSWITKLQKSTELWIPQPALLKLSQVGGTDSIHWLKNIIKLKHQLERPWFKLWLIKGNHGLFHIKFWRADVQSHSETRQKSVEPGHSAALHYIPMPAIVPSIFPRK
jgi:hypothetical protein